MKKSWAAVLSPVLLGLAGAALRRLEVRRVFEPDTGLALPHPLSVILPLFLAASALLFLALALPRRGRSLAFGACFAPLGQGGLYLLVSPAMLLMAAGGLQTLSAGGALSMALGAGAAAAGFGLLYAAVQWRRQGNGGAALLLPVLFALGWLLILYQRFAAWPVTARFYVPVLAAALAACAFYQAAAFAFRQGSRRMFRFLTPTAIVLCLAALGDEGDLLGRGMYLACAAALLCFWAQEKEPAPEEDRPPAPAENAGGTEEKERG